LPRGRSFWKRFEKISKNRYNNCAYLTDLKNEKTYFISKVNSDDISYLGFSDMSIHDFLLSPDSKKLYIQSNILNNSMMGVQVVGDDHYFNSGVVEIDLKSGKILKSKYANLYGRLSKVDLQGNLWIDDGDVRYLFNWDNTGPGHDAHPSPKLPLLAESPDGKWELRQGSHGVVRVAR
jgi:hypothetical protein